MVRGIILCGSTSEVKTNLLHGWSKKNKSIKRIVIAQSIAKQHSITREVVQKALDEQNRLELRHLEAGHSFVSYGGVDPLVYACQYLGQETSDQLVQTPSAKSCLQRYSSCEYLVVVLCPPPSSDEENTFEQLCEFTRLLREFLHKYRIPSVCTDKTAQQELVLILEQALTGNFPFNADNLKDYGLNLPFVITERAHMDKQVSLRRVEIGPRSISLSFYPFTRGETNRMVDRYDKESFVLLNFHKELAADVAVKILRKGVCISGEEFQFLGCSSSGLKSRTCYMLCGTPGDVQNVLKECGNFSAIKSVSKRLSRIGLLFSAVKSTNVEVLDEHVTEVDDIETPAGNFTDGCGSISMELAQRVVEGAKLELALPKVFQHPPSVLQIRYQGCKGVVMTDPNLKKTTMLVRKSMKKFKPGTKPMRELWLCGYSRPYSYGHLNRQFIMLLSGLNVKDEVFLQLQQEHFQRLQTVTEDPEVAIKMLLWNNQPDIATKVAKCSPGEFKSDSNLQAAVSHLRSNLIPKLEKLRLLVVKSRNIYGVCDPLGVLKYGECFFRPTIHGTPKTLSGCVTVAKNPCYLLGDIRVLTAVNVPLLEHLVDCIVFPTQGKRPHPLEIAGSDLDGDQYFVCWDPNLVPPKLRRPYNYPSVEALLPPTVTRDNMIVYFAKQNMQSNVMGKIDKLFTYWADLKGVNCTECEQLGMLFSRSVDAAKTGDPVCIPRHLQPPKGYLQSRDKLNDMSQTSGSTTFNSDSSRVWKKMECEAATKKRELSKEVATSLLSSDATPAVCEKFIWSLVFDKELNMSAFELFQFVQRWCNAQKLSEEEATDTLLEFSDHINFGEFTVDQQKAAIDSGIPVSVVTNALNKSKILLPDMLESFLLDSPHCGWRFYFCSQSAEFNWQHLLKAVQRHPESIVIFQLPHGIKFALHFLDQFQLGETDLVTNTGSIAAYFFSPHFGFQHRHVLGPQYNLHLESNILELYRGVRRQTFIWFGNEEDDAKISIDLTRFDSNIFRKAQHPKVRKDSLYSMEVFVKSFHHEPAYLDIYTPYQPDDILPEDLEDTITAVEIEQLPSDCEDETETASKTSNLDSYTPVAALSLLRESARKGNCTCFREVLQLIVSNDTQSLPATALKEALLTLLVQLSTRHAHKVLIPHLADSLQIIITLNLHHFPILSPVELLKLLSAISRLHCFQLVEQMAVPLTSKLQVSQCSEYLEVVSHWEDWYSLAPRTALRVAGDLYAFYDSFLTPLQGSSSSEQPSDTDCTMENDSSEVVQTSLHELACMKDKKSPVDNVQVERYCCYFAHLVLQHFLAETENIQKHIQSTENAVDTSLTMLKAYDFNDPHQVALEGSNILSESTKEEKSCKEESAWRVGFSRSEAVGSKKFTEGTYVAIHLMSQTQSSRIVSHPVALGCLVQVSSPPANIVVDVSAPVPHCLRRSVRLGKGHWELRLVGNITTFKRTTKVLLDILRCQKRSMELLPLLVHPDAFPPTVTAGDRDNTVKSSTVAATVNKAQASSFTTAAAVTTDGIHAACSVNGGFNPSQEQAIVAALKQRLTLIHGPPGTGKTYVACEIVFRQLAQFEDCCVLVAAETNMAVDNLTRQLLQLRLRVVRVGNQGRIAPDIRHSSLEYQVQVKSILSKRRSQFLDPKLAKQVLQAAQVVATTCAGVGDSALKGMYFPFVLIDEATQATEPVSLLPIVHHCEQIVLIGDPEQLAPTIPFPTSSAHGPSVHMMAVTLFHRLQSVLPSFFLEEQHRMHPELAEFPSQAFYNGKLKSAMSTTMRPPLNVPWLDQCRPLLFIDIPSHNCERKVGTSFENTAEAEVVVEVVRSLLSYEVSPLEVVVLTPYTGQVQCIRQKLSLVASRVEVCTVDSFQGREKDVVVFSTVCNHPGRLDFVGNRYRMNVLLTRMKRGLVGVGSKNTLEGDELWAKWLQQATVLAEGSFRDRLLPTGSKSSTKDSSKGARRPIQVEYLGLKEPSSHNKYSDSRPYQSPGVHAHDCGQPLSRRDRRRHRRPIADSSSKDSVPSQRDCRKVSQLPTSKEMKDQLLTPRPEWRLGESSCRPKLYRGQGHKQRDKDKVNTEKPYPSQEGYIRESDNPSTTLETRQWKQSGLSGYPQGQGRYSRQDGSPRLTSPVQGRRLVQEEDSVHSNQEVDMGRHSSAQTQCSGKRGHYEDTRSQYRPESQYHMEGCFQESKHRGISSETLQCKQLGLRNSPPGQGGYRRQDQSPSLAPPLLGRQLVQEEDCTPGDRSGQGVGMDQHRGAQTQGSRNRSNDPGTSSETMQWKTGLQSSHPGQGSCSYRRQDHNSRGVPPPQERKQAQEEDCAPGGRSGQAVGMGRHSSAKTQGSRKKGRTRPHPRPENSQYHVVESTAHQGQVKEGKVKTTGEVSLGKEGQHEDI